MTKASLKGGIERWIARSNEWVLWWNSVQKK